MDITKFNEFINSNILIFNETYKIMFLETAHLSSTDSIRENKNYKDIVLMGNKIIPHIMNEILNNDGNIILYFLVEDITGIFDKPKIVQIIIHLFINLPYRNNIVFNISKFR